MNKTMLFVTALFTLCACTNERGARHALEDEGYENIKITGYAPFSCGEDDLSSTGFKATNVKGREVRGVVCCGAFKGCTVRH